MRHHEERFYRTLCGFWKMILHKKTVIYSTREKLEGITHCI